MWKLFKITSRRNSMAGIIENGVVRRNELVGPSIYLMQIELPETARKAKPGQFIHIKINDGIHLLRRPISIAGADIKKGEIEIIYRVVGIGTKRMSMLKEGDIVDSLGPLGTSFTMDKEHIVGVGGGVGIAPILFMARRAKEGQMTVVIGGRNKEEVFWKDLFPSTVKELIVTTDDGSCGRKGFSISVLPELFQKDKVDELCVCGPGVMMRNAVQMAKDALVYCEVSMERRMGCGIGTCLACVCQETKGGHKKVCLDGPVFPSTAVIL